MMLPMDNTADTAADDRTYGHHRFLLLHIIVPIDNNDVYSIVRSYLWTTLMSTAVYDRTYGQHWCLRPPAIVPIDNTDVYSCVRSYLWTTLTSTAAYDRTYWQHWCLQLRTIVPMDNTDVYSRVRSYLWTTLMSTAAYDRTYGQLIVPCVQRQYFDAAGDVQTAGVTAVIVSPWQQRAELVGARTAFLPEREPVYFFALQRKTIR
jgi:hypothetical protein